MSYIEGLSLGLTVNKRYTRLVIDLERFRGDILLYY